MRAGTIVGDATQVVRATPQEVLSFVLDLERYRQADHKIGRVGKVQRTGDTGFVQFSGRVRGLPGPSGTYPFTISDTRLVFGSPVAGAARWMLEFEGSFEFEPVDGGTRVTHREEFRFKRPWRGLARLFLGKWLATDTAREMVRLKGLLEDGQDTAPPSVGVSDGSDGSNPAA